MRARPGAPAKGRAFCGEGSDNTAAIEALEELRGWLKNSPDNQRRIEGILAELKAPGGLSDEKKRELRHLLSRDMLFHVKWLGDCDVRNFPADGTSYPWWNYLSRVCEICQNALR